MASTGRALAGPSATAQIVEDRMGYAFAQSLDFELVARASQPIESIVLRYTIGQDENLPRNRRIPVFEPGNEVRATHVEDLVRGQIPPASEIAWWWTLEFADGSRQETTPRSLRYLDDRFVWDSMQDRAARVWWYDGDRALAGEVLATSLEALDELAALIGSPPDRPIEIVTYASQADLRPSLYDRGGTYETRLATLGARVAPDILVLDTDTPGEALNEVIRHELSHVVLNLHFEEDYVDAPLWLDEGLAMYVEGPLDAEETAVLDRAIREDRLMSLRSLTSFPGETSQVLLAYAQSRDIVDHLIESRGEDDFRRLLDEIGSGEHTPDEALLTVYGQDQLSLYQAYRAARGLEPATPAEPEEARASSPRSSHSRGGNQPGGWPCASLALVLPSLGLLCRRSRRRTRFEGS